MENENYTCLQCAYHVRKMGFDETCGYKPGELVWRKSHTPACHCIKLKEPEKPD